MDNNLNNTIELPAPSIKYWENNNNLIELNGFKEQYESMSSHTKEQEELYNKVCDNIKNINKNTMEDYDLYVSKLDTILGQIELGMQLNPDDKSFLINFIKEYKNNSNQGLFVDFRLRDFYDGRLLQSFTNNKYLNCEDIYNLLGIEENKVQEVVNNKEENQAMKLTLNNNSVDKGFVNIIYIILSIVVSCLIFVYLFFINR